MLAPKKLKFGVLPMNKHSRLMFYLCEKCSSELNPNNECSCSQDDRKIRSVWTHIEFKLAISKGYRILKVNNAYI
mgnify:CR=1 FL=1